MWKRTFNRVDLPATLPAVDADDLAAVYSEVDVTQGLE
jgi:hypothetical protein